MVSPPIPLGPWAVQVVDLNDSERAEHERAEALAAAAMRELGDAARAHTVQGVPEVELAARSSALDLLVVGSRGYGPLKRLMLGSTSSKLVRSAACPVIVIARGADEVVAQEPAVTASQRA